MAVTVPSYINDALVDLEVKKTISRLYQDVVGQLISQGPQGPQGPQGARGATGPQGPQG